MTTTVFSAETIRTNVRAQPGTWLTVRNGRVTGAGTGSAPAGNRHVPLGGATVVPAFRDAHVHLPATGLYAAGMDLRGETRAGAVLDAYRHRAATGDALLFGGNIEDPLDGPLTARELDTAVGDRPALLARADMHSCIVSSALLRALDLEGVPGVDLDDAGEPTGYLREQAASEAWRWFDSNLPRAQQIDAIRAAIQLAYAKGVTEVHEMFVVEWRGWDSVDVFVDALEGTRLKVVPYFGTTDVDRVAAMGMPRIGGDWFLDGSFGSHTAWMKQPYASNVPSGSTPHGISYRRDDEVLDFFHDAQMRGLQVGVHAIGDAAIEQCLSAWEEVAQKVGLEEVRRLAHRIEHLECAEDEQIARAARLGMWGSIQPAFDRYWGGGTGLYAQRIGPERAASMNRFSSMLRAGLSLAAGSDSTVTPLDPLLQMDSLLSHHEPTERLPRPDAFWLVSGAVARMVGDDDRGTLDVGQIADLVVLDGDPLSNDQDVTAIEVLETWSAGERVWSAEQSSS